MQRQAGDPDADADGHCGQCDPQAQRGFHRGPAGGQAALGEDQHERRRAQRAGQVGVLELDAEHRFAQQHADAQVEQERGQTEPDRHPHRDDREQQDRGADAEEGRHTTHSTSCCSPGGGILPGDTDLD
nr:hypothetical protein GCM10017745_24000 [Saccharothrix mutabilis subsp. capreolus]